MRLFSWAGLMGSAACALVLGCGGGGSGDTGPVQTGPTITGVTMTPTAATVTIGATQPFTATVSGTGAFNSAVTWMVAGAVGMGGERWIDR